MKYFIGEWYADQAIMYSILEGVDFYKCGRTGTVMEGIPKNGRSMMWGASWRRTCKQNTNIPGTGLHYTKCREQNPELEDVFKEYVGIYWKKFKFTQVQMNKNFPCPPHKDGTNVGNSILVGFGNYTGGNINIEQPNGEVFSMDIRDEKGVIFNGANALHWVSPFNCEEGDNRYSLVFFNSSYNKNDPDKGTGIIYHKTVTSAKSQLLPEDAMWGKT